MQAEIHLLHKSDFYHLKDFRCFCVECSLSKLEQLADFSICFARSGYYEQRVFRRNHEIHVGRVVVSKPEIEYVIRHIDNQPDLCTAFNFTSDFYERVKDYYKKEADWFFNNPDLHSLLLTSHADVEYLHQVILSKVKQQSSLEIDDLVLQLVEKVMCTLGNKPIMPDLTPGIKKYHLSTIEKARDFLVQHFSKNITLQQLADHCCVSLFHFSRLFKTVMNQSPHQYLTGLRLSHARLLLQSTNNSVTDIAFQCGFNSLEHFNAIFKQQFKFSPGMLRSSVKAH